MLTVSDEAKEYIMTKKKSVYLLYHGSNRLCCGNVDFGPSVYMGNPPDDKEYCVKEINGVTVYLPQNFFANVPLTIEVGSFLGIKTLHIEGWKLI
ncbi:MAG: hypothetical protein K0R78_33 [Pelosinus sp.]|nr:hypothetical protein [Pelosinus sp.]